VNEARRLQLEVFRRMTPEERIYRGMLLTRAAFEARDARIRRQHPGISEDELRRVRAREILRLPPDAPLP
jgi:hypothetical protein